MRGLLGEDLTAETVAYLHDGVMQDGVWNGMHLCGATDPKFETIRMVIEEDSDCRVTQGATNR